MRSLLAADLLADLAATATPWTENTEYSVEDTAHATEAGVFSTLGAEGEAAAAPDRVAFAQALFDSEAILFGAPWSGETTEQAALFADGARYLPLVDVTHPDRTLNEIGEAYDITEFPTWEFADGTMVTGIQSLEDLSALAGVPIPESDQPYLKGIEDTIVLAGAPLHVALDGYHPAGSSLTYTVTSDNPLVEPTVLEGNRSMRIEVEDWGEMVFELFEQRAPRPTGRVIELAETGFYDGVIFHRVIDGFMIQGGDPTGTGMGGSDLGTFDDQYHPELMHVSPGVLSYAKSGDDTNDSQFFVTLAPTRWLDFNHSIFGQLVEGQHVLDAIGSAHTDADDPEVAPEEVEHRPTVPVVMDRVEIFQDTENAVVMLKADPDAVGQQANITVTVEDALGNAVEQTFQVAIEADPSVPPPFLADLPDFTTPVDTPLQIQLEAIDIRGNPVYFDAGELGDVEYDLDVDHDTGLVVVTPPAGYVGELELLVGVRGLEGDAWDTQLVQITVEGEAVDLPEPVVELAAESDSNIVGDNVTNISPMTFVVSNVVDGATVQLFTNGDVIGQAVASGESVQITTEALGDRGDGEYVITAYQTLAGETSDSSETITVTLDTVPPPDFTSTPPAEATSGQLLVYDAQNPEEGTPGFRYSLEGAPAGATIDPDSGEFRWTPTVDQGGLTSFQIIASDLAGNTTAQHVEIDVTVVEQLAMIELRVADEDENPLTSVRPGEDFYVWAYVQDLRDDAQGVFAAYMDLEYDPDLVTSYATHWDEVAFGDKYQNGRAGDFSTPGQIEQIGAFGPITPIGSGKEVLFVLRYQADAPGEVHFTPYPSELPGRELLLFGLNDEVPWEAVTMVPASLIVGSGLIANDDLFNVDEDSVDFPLDVLANDINEAGGEMTIIETGPTSQGGTVTIAADGQSLLYTPVPDFFGEEEFTYTITNGEFTSTANVTVQVAPVNDPPIAVDDLFEVDENSQENFLDVLDNDQIDPDIDETLWVMEVGPTSHGGLVQIAPNGTHLLYTPAAGFNGTETFTYTIADRPSGHPEKLTDTATVTIDVRAIGRPTAVNDTATIELDAEAQFIDVLANDSPEVPGRELTVTAVGTSGADAVIEIAEGGTGVLYTPAPGFSGTDSFVYTVQEADGGENQATVHVTVGDPDPDDPDDPDDPVQELNARDDAFTITMNAAPRTLDVMGNDVFPAGTQITSVTQGTQGGTVTISSGSRDVRYQPAADFEGDETFTYTLTDPSGETATATVSITVTPYAARNISGYVKSNTDDSGVGGLEVTLSGMDDFGTDVNRTTQTRADGRYEFADLAPGDYKLSYAGGVFLQEDGTELTVNSTSSDGDSHDNNFDNAGRDPDSIGIADLLARAPNQTSISTTESLLLAVQAGGSAHWYSVLAGWDGFAEAGWMEAELSEDAEELTLTAWNDQGDPQQTTLDLSERPYFVKRLATNDDSHLIRIDVSPQYLNMQPGTPDDPDDPDDPDTPEPPSVSVDSLLTNDNTPTITGTVSHGDLQVVVNNHTYTAGDGHLSVEGDRWTLEIPAEHALDDGIYTVSASATDADGNVGQDGTTNELVVDTVPPAVTVKPLTTADPTPALSGTVSEGSLQVVVNNRTYTAGDGHLSVVGTEWVLQIPDAHTLADGVYTVSATATDAAGNVGSDTTSDELRIDSSVPVVTVDPLITNTNTPTLTGTVSEGDLRVVVNDRTYVAGDGLLTVTNSNWTLQIPATHGLPDGTYDVEASATNAAGTVGSAGTINELVIDTVPPTVSFNALTTADPTPTLSGSVSDGDLEVVVDGRTYTAGDGHLSVVGTDWTLEIPAEHALAEGAHTVVVSATDAAGNVGTRTATDELVINLSLPSVSADSLITNDPTPTLTGAVSDGTLQVVVGDQTYTAGDGHLIVDDEAWSLTIPAEHALPEGTFVIEASATNVAGTESVTAELVIDLTPPVVTVDPLNTTDTTPTLTGTVSDGELQVEVAGQVYTPGDGRLTVEGEQWTLQIPAEHALAEGAHTVTATATDAAGNVGSDPATDQLVIDLSLPEVTVDPLITNDPTPTLTGAVSHGDLEVMVGGQTYTAGDGHLTVEDEQWTLQIPAEHALVEGVYTVTATATDAEGRVGSDATTDELVIDLTPPVVTIDPLITNDVTPTLTGTVSEGTLQVTVAEQTYTAGDGHLTVEGDQWTLQIPAEQPLDEGTYTVLASAVDAAGNEGQAEDADQLVIDTTPPEVAVHPLATTLSTPAITGTLSDGELEVTVAERTYTAGDGHLTVTGQQWTLQIPAEHALAEGTYTVEANATDAAGNTGSDPTTDQLVIDASLPMVTVDPLITNSVTPELTGTVSHGDLQVTVGGQTYTAGDGHLTVDGELWTLHLPAEHALTDGVYAVTATATDTEGNAGSDGTTDELVIDTTPPQVTVDMLLANSTTPTVTGTVSEGELQVTVNEQTYTAGDGHLSVEGDVWTLQIPAEHALEEGTYTVSATATDAAGNVGNDGTTDELVIDLTPPVVTVDPLITNHTTPLITGTFSDGALEVRVDGQVYQVGDGHLTVEDEQWMLQIPAEHPLEEGTYTVSATATDAAGNVGNDDTTDELVIDLTPPAVTVDPLTTSDTTPQLSGTVSEGTLEVTVGGNVYVEGDGHLSVSDTIWTLQIPEEQALEPGVYTVSATATDAAGNVGSDLTSEELVIEGAPLEVTVEPLITNETTPLLTGTVSGGTLEVIVDEHTYVQGDGHLSVSESTWELQIPEENALEEGVYTVSATTTDDEGNTASDETMDELIIDLTPPIVTVDPLTTSDPAPELTGLVMDDRFPIGEGALQVEIGDETYLSGDGHLTIVDQQWFLQIPHEHALSPGTYPVMAMAIDAAGNISDPATDQLEILDPEDEESAEGEAADWVWAEEDFLEDLDWEPWSGADQTDGYARAVDTLLAAHATS